MQLLVLSQSDYHSSNLLWILSLSCALLSTLYYSSLRQSYSIYTFYFIIIHLLFSFTLRLFKKNIIPAQRYSLKLAYVILNVLVFTYTLNKNHYILWMVPPILFKLGHQLTLLTHRSKIQLQRIQKGGKQERYSNARVNQRKND